MKQRKVTYAKCQRAIDAIVALIECDDVPLRYVSDLDRAADLIRIIRGDKK